MAYNKKYAELGESVIDYVNDREDKIEGAFEDINDYVIERGSNDRGVWEKWKSGLMVQNTMFQAYVSTTVDDGGVYISPISELWHPIEYVSGVQNAKINVLAHSSRTGVLLHTADSKKITYSFWSTKSLTEQRYYIFVETKGRWK